MPGLITRLLLNWIILSFSISVASYFLPFIHIVGETVWDRVGMALVAGLLLGLFNLLVKPVIKILSLPINILTLGIFNIFINAGILWVVDYFIDGLEVSGFWGYIWGSLVITIISVILSNLIFGERKKKE